MTVEFVRLLQIQRNLYDLPRGQERFQAYLRAMTDPQTGDLALPLADMNPMAREHVPELLDSYLDLDADQAAEEASILLSAEHPDIDARFRVGLVVADDRRGGWTNRFTTEFSSRCQTQTLHKRGWLVGMLWASEPPSVELAVTALRTAVHRAAFIERNGFARTVGEMLAQEGWAAARAGARTPTLEPDDLEYTRTVVAPTLKSTDRATVIGVLYGDAAAHALGYPPQGLSDRAGLALALHDARQQHQKRSGVL